MKRYIRARRYMSDCSDRVTLNLHCVSHSLGEYKFKDDEGTLYRYDRGTFPTSKFSQDLYNIVQKPLGDHSYRVNPDITLTISARLVPEGANGIIVRYALLSPRIISWSE